MSRLQRISFDELRDGLSVATTQENVQNVLGRFAARNGFEWFTYVTLHQYIMRGFSNYPDDWQRHYLDNQCLLIDPVMDLARQSKTAFIWSRSAVSIGRSRSRKQMRFMRDAASMGIKSGLSIPVQGGFGTSAAITFASSDDSISEEFVADQFLLLSVGAFLHAVIPHSVGLRSCIHACPLTQAQLETLSWLVQGKTSAEIADIRRVSSRAVEYQLHAIRDKLGTNTTVQSVAVAVERSWITL